MGDRKVVKELLSFIESSPTAFHAVDSMKKMLEAESGSLQKAVSIM